MNKHCAHHAMFHPSCIECRRVNPQPEDDNIPTPFDFSAPSMPSMPDLTSPDPDTSPAPDPAPDFGGFDGGTSGGGGADGSF